MKINKVFDITLNIDNIHDIFTKDINNKLLTLIEKNISINAIKVHLY